MLDVDRGATNESFLPYFIGYKMCFLISWIITFLKRRVNIFFFFFSIIKNTNVNDLLLRIHFGTLKKTFKEFLGKSNLHETFILNLFVLASYITC